MSKEKQRVAGISGFLAGRAASVDPRHRATAPPRHRRAGRCGRARDVTTRQTIRINYLRARIAPFVAIYGYDCCGISEISAYY